MKFSIVTISYNQAQFLDCAIRSVIEQDFPNLEYIVVDPGSTDGSRKIIDRYRDRIDRIVFEPDDGPADGLNKGFAQATGEVFGFLNSDDYLLPGALSCIAEAFVDHSAVDVISGHGLVVDQEGGIRRRIYSDMFSLKMAAYGACVLIQPSTFFRSHAFKRVGGFSSKNNSNWDGELFVDMAIAGCKFAVLNRQISAYRIHRDSITGSAKLAKAHHMHSQRMFRKIMGRTPTKVDSFIAQVFRVVRKGLNPRDTFERVLKGPVFGASK